VISSEWSGVCRQSYSLSVKNPAETSRGWASKLQLLTKVLSSIRSAVLHRTVGLLTWIVPSVIAVVMLVSALLTLPKGPASI
jgi:hypothetical protein